MFYEHLTWFIVLWIRVLVARLSGTRVIHRWPWWSHFFHHSEVALRLRLSRAGQHAHQVQAHFFRNLTLGHVQLDELYTTLRNTAYDRWVWVAFDPVPKLLPALQLGPRAQDVAYALLHALSQVLAPGCPEGTPVSVNGLWGKAAWHFGAKAMIGLPGVGESKEICTQASPSGGIAGFWPRNSTCSFLNRPDRS